MNIYLIVKLRDLTYGDAFKFPKTKMNLWDHRSDKRQKKINYRLNRTQRMVENTFGISANRL